MTPKTSCGVLHLQPEKWVQRPFPNNDHRRYCPGCGKFMGYVAAKQK
jgi:hypothetical protein